MSDKSQTKKKDFKKKEVFGDQLDKLYGPEEDQIKKILTKKILERLQK